MTERLNYTDDLEDHFHIFKLANQISALLTNHIIVFMQLYIQDKYLILSES